MKFAMQMLMAEVAHGARCIGQPVASRLQRATGVVSQGPPNYEFESCAGGLAHGGAAKYPQVGSAL